MNGTNRAKNNTKMSNVILTGATGILGSHILYELLGQKIAGLFNGKIIVLVRSNSRGKASERVAQVLKDKFTPEYLHGYTTVDLLEMLEIVSCDLKELNEVIDQVSSKVSSATIIHCGSSVNLGTDHRAEKDVYWNNYQATLQLLQKFALITERFIYISTAFSSGHRAGEIKDSFLNISYRDKHFRNPYERYQTATEIDVARICDEQNIQWQIFRPSLICGRLVDNHKYYISKHLVFYMIGEFFVKMAKRYPQQPLLRILMKDDVSMNIVPVDYVAKTVIKGIEANSPSELNIVSEENLLLKDMFSHMLYKTGYFNYLFVPEVPEDQNEVERFYYKWIGSQVNHYIDTPVHHFNTNELRYLLRDLQEPAAVHHFPKIFDYAYTNA